MINFASIAQMESSRFVGGSAQTQALLLAPIHSFPLGGRSDGRSTSPLPSPVDRPSLKFTEGIMMHWRARQHAEQAVPAVSGGIRQPRARHGAGGTRANLIPMPSRSIQTGCDPLESHNMSDAARDRIATIGALSFVLIVCALFLGLRALALGFFNLH